MVLAALGRRGARARSQGLLCMVLGALSPGPGCTDSSVRAVPEEASAPKTWLNRCLRVLFRSARGKASPRKSRAGHASGPRRGQVDSTTAMQEPCICEAGLLSHLVPSRGGPRGPHRAREHPALPST